MQRKQEYKIQVAKEGVPITMLTLSLPRLPERFFSSVWLVENPRMLKSDEDDAFHDQDDLAKMKL